MDGNLNSKLSTKTREADGIFLEQKLTSLQLQLESLQDAVDR